MFSSRTALYSPHRTDRILSVYLWSLSYLLPYKWTFIFFIASSVVITTGEMSIFKFFQYFIDEVFPEKKEHVFFQTILMISGILLLLFIATVAQNIFRRNVQEKASRDLQYSIFRKLRSLGYSYYEKHPVGESLSLMNSEVLAVQDLYRRFFPVMITGIIFTMVSVIFMLSYSWKLTLTIIPGGLFYYLAGPYFEKKASTFGKKTARLRVNVNQKVYETISSIKELRAHQTESWALNRFLKSLKIFNETSTEMIWYAFWRGAVRRISYYIGGIIVIIYGFHSMNNGSLSAGTFVAFLLCYFQAMHHITITMISLTEQKMLMYQIQQLYQFMCLQPDVKEKTPPVTLSECYGYIECKNVVFKYSVGNNVINGLNMTIRSGERVALVGTSGQGKTTVLKLIARFYDPDQGEIRLDGVPIHQLSFEQLRENIGYVFQETYLFGLSVYENIRFGYPEATEKEVHQAARVAGAHQFIMDFPYKYNTLLGDRGVRLSGGQKQRISIARMLIKDPKIILLDEATASLDTYNENLVQAQLNHLFEGRTMITVAHRISTVKNYDRILVLHDGSIIESGTYHELMNRRGKFYHMAYRMENDHG